MRLLACGFVLALLLAGAAHAWLVTTPADQQFAAKAASHSAGETLLGNLATSRGQNRAVAEFGRRVARDNRAEYDELRRIAAQSGISLPPGIPASHERTLQRFVKLPPDYFDFAYAAPMVREYEWKLGAFQQQLKEGKPPALRAFAHKKLPQVQSQLDPARAMFNAVMFES